MKLFTLKILNTHTCMHIHTHVHTCIHTQTNAPSWLHTHVDKKINNGNCPCQILNGACLWGEGRVVLVGGLLGIKCCNLVAESQVLKFGAEREFRFIRISICLYLILIKQVELSHLIFDSLVCLVGCLRQVLILLLRLAWSLLCSPGWLPWFSNPPV